MAADTGLCGTAAFLKTRVIVPDVASESTWREEYRGPALKNGIRAGWSQPILTKDNQVLGTFAIYSAEPRVPTNEDLALIEVGARITLVAIERQQSQEDLRNALDEIQKSESKLRQVIDAIPALAWCNLPDGPNEFLNKGWHEYTGLSSEESHGWGWQTAFHPDDLPPLMEKWMKMLASGEPDEIEARLRRHDGVYRWFLIRAEPFRDESGKIVRWYGTSTDIDDRKRAEEALQSSERNLSLIINTIPTFIHVLRTDGSVQYVNQAVLDYTVSLWKMCRKRTIALVFSTRRMWRGCASSAGRRSHAPYRSKLSNVRWVRTADIAGSWSATILCSMIREGSIDGMRPRSTSRIENGRRTRWHAKRLFGLT